MQVRAKDKRDVCDEIAERYLLAGDEGHPSAISLSIHWAGSNCTDVIDQFQFAVWMDARRKLGRGFDYDDLDIVRRQIAGKVNTLDIPFVGRRVQMFTSSPVELVGRYAPSVSRRPDLTPCESTVNAMRVMSSTPFRLDWAVCDVFLAYRETLPEREREAFLPTGIIDQWNMIGSSVFYVPHTKSDQSGRIYPNGYGVSPCGHKILRAVIRAAVAEPLADVDRKRLNTWIGSEFHRELGGRSAERFVNDILDDPSGFLQNGGSVMAVGAAYGWRKSQGPSTDYLVYIDVPASGLGHIYAEMGHPLTAQMVVMNHASYVHPHATFSHALRNVDIHNLRDLPLQVIIDEEGKPILTSGMYGGGKMAAASMLSGMEYDGKDWIWVGRDDEETPRIPRLPGSLINLGSWFQLGYSVLQGRVVDSEQCMEGLVSLCKTYVDTLRLTFPPIKACNKLSMAEWKEGMLSDGLPNAIPDEYGYDLRPTPFLRRNALKPVEVDAAWYLSLIHI